MQFVVVTRDNWAELVRSSGIRLEVIAVRTGKSYSAVYRYLRGDRTPPDAWIAQVAAVLSDATAEGKAS
jgi:hypothetical protein